jgi:predicted nucleotidyltransferase
MPEPRHTVRSKSERWYRGTDVPMSVIRRFARDVAKRFRPDKIILFGSHAYGKPHADSDVDILVIMPARNQLDQAFKIHSTLLPPFPLDIIVRTPKNLQWRLEEGESFHTEILTKGKVLYEKNHSGVGGEGRRRLSPGQTNHRRRRSVS